MITIYDPFRFYIEMFLYLCVFVCVLSRKFTLFFYTRDEEFGPVNCNKLVPTPDKYTEIYPPSGNPAENVFHETESDYNEEGLYVRGE